MKSTRKTTTNWLSAIGYRLSAIGYRLIFGILIASLTWQTHAACTFFDDFKDNKNGTVTDPRTGLIWKTCAEGFKWTAEKSFGANCNGSFTDVNWFLAMQLAKESRYLGKTDWRLPTPTEFSSVVGLFKDCIDNKDKDNKFAASTKIAHNLGPLMDDEELDNFPGEFWSSTATEYKTAIYTSFLNGHQTYDSWMKKKNIILVRAGSTKGILEFKNTDLNLDAHKMRLTSREKYLLELEIAEYYKKIKLKTSSK